MKDTFSEYPQFSMGTELSPPGERILVFDKLMDLVYPSILCECTNMYFAGVQKLDLWNAGFETTKLAVPNWNLIPVWGKIDEGTFFYMLSRGQFPVNQQLRNIKNLEYVYLRDTWHDTMGHVPYLFDKDYTDMMILFGLAYQLADSDSIRRALGRLYWAIVEFGMLDEGKEIKPLGAGVMSSKDELILAVSNSNNTHREFDLLEICSWDYDPYGVQDRHYVVPSIRFVSNQIKKLM